MNPNILRPGSNDEEIQDRLQELVGLVDDANPLKAVRITVDKYFEKVQDYDVQAPFPVLPKGIRLTLAIGKFHMFSYRNKIFHGQILNGPNPSGFKFKASSIEQVMADGSLVRKRFNGTADIDVDNNEAWIDIHDPTYPNGFWGGSDARRFHQKVPYSAMVYERRFYSILKPFYQFVGLINEYKRVEQGKKQGVLDSIKKLLYDSLTKVDFSGKLPKPVHRFDTSIPRPSDITIRRKNKDEVVISWDAVHTYDWFVRIGYGPKNNVEWEEDSPTQVKGNSIVRKINGDRIHVVVAFRSYNSDSNQAPMKEPDNPNSNMTVPSKRDASWSYATYETPESKHFTTVQLLDIDKFRLQIDGKYETIYDLFEMLNIPNDVPLTNALAILKRLRDEVISRDNFVKWEAHLDIPFVDTPLRSWNQFTYEERVFVIHSKAIMDKKNYIQHMEYYGAPYVVTDPTGVTDYQRPAQQGGINLLTSSSDGKKKNRKKQQDFHIEDKVTEVSKNRHYYKIGPNGPNNGNILQKPWPETKNFFKIRDRSRNRTEFAQFIYLNTEQERQACKRLRRIKRSLDHSDRVGFPVMEKEIAAPFNYQSNVHAARVTNFGPNNYDRTQAFPSLVQLPRVMTFDNARTPQVDYFDASNSFEFDVIKMRPAKRIKVRENANGWLPHPVYPGRLKVESERRIQVRRPGEVVSNRVLANKAALIDEANDSVILQL